jgi:simple sugar transport system ATP-binding protein
LASELSLKPGAIIAAKPTRGLDIGAAEYVRKQLNSQINDGTAVLLISEDLDEIFALSDRIAVIYDGKIMGILNRDQETREKVGLLMAGIREEDHQDVSL